MADLASFLQKQSCCEKLVCTTCGGILGFWMSLDEYMAGSPPLEIQLLSLPPQVTQTSRSLGHRLPVLLDRLGPTAAHEVIDHWVATGRDCEAFATSLLSWPPKRAFPTVLAEFVVECLPPRALRDRPLRTELRDRFPELVASSAPLQEAFRGDREADSKAREEAETRQRGVDRARQKLLDELAAMEPAGRFRRLLVIEGLRVRDLPSTLAAATADQLESLTHAETELLIRYLGWSPWGEWESILKLLFHLRHDKRAKEMDGIRAGLAGLPPREQLLALLGDPSVPIELYPPELANAVSSETLDSVPVDLQDRLRELLAGTRLRRWRQARARLFPVPASTTGSPSDAALHR